MDVKKPSFNFSEKIKVLEKKVYGRYRLLISWSPQEIFNIEGKTICQKFLRLRILEQRGYVKRHRNSAKTIAYISFTNDGVL